MRILIVTTGVPFVRGGAEVHAEGLQRALTGAGHDAELVYIPFKWYPPERVLDHMLACRLFDLTECSGVRIDAVIGLKFPAYYVPHPNKILWILHQHRQAYDLWDRDISDLKYYPNGFEVREAIREADKRLLPEAKQIYANSLNVSKRLKHYSYTHLDVYKRQEYTSERLLRLPFYNDLTENEQAEVVEAIRSFPMPG